MKPIRTITLSDLNHSFASELLSTAFRDYRSQIFSPSEFKRGSFLYRFNFIPINRPSNQSFRKECPIIDFGAYPQHVNGKLANILFKGVVPRFSYCDGVCNRYSEIYESYGILGMNGLSCTSDSPARIVRRISQWFMNARERIFTVEEARTLLTKIADSANRGAGCYVELAEIRFCCMADSVFARLSPEAEIILSQEFPYSKPGSVQRLALENLESEILAEVQHAQL